MALPEVVHGGSRLLTVNISDSDAGALEDGIRKAAAINGALMPRYTRPRGCAGFAGGETGATAKAIAEAQAA